MFYDGMYDVVPYYSRCGDINNVVPCDDMQQLAGKLFSIR
jgi:hypothetical protein